VADRGVVGTVTQPPLQRSTQTLPVPLGGLAPVHRRSTRLRRTLRAHRSAPILALALISAAAGVWLSIAPRSFDAGMDGAGVHVDGITLTPLAQKATGSQVFTGAATLVVDTASSRMVTAATVMTWNGVRATVRCVYLRSSIGGVETCLYELGSQRLTSTDQFSASRQSWYRQYSDGVAITITVPRGTTVIPVPFPLGR
jgi:hypothetical protein